MDLKKTILISLLIIINSYNMDSIKKELKNKTGFFLGLGVGATGAACFLLYKKNKELNEKNKIISDYNNNIKNYNKTFELQNQLIILQEKKIQEQDLTIYNLNQGIQIIHNNIIQKEGNLS